MQLIRNTLTLLILISSSVSLAEIKSSTCFDESGTTNLAQYAKQCDLDRENLKIMEQQYNKALTLNEEKSITDSSGFYWASVYGAFLFGFVAANAAR